MENLATKTVREIALEMPVTTRVFEQYKIDYCCGGGKNFLDACQAAGVSPDIISQKIESVIESGITGDEINFENKTLRELMNHIIEKHHDFTREEITNLTPLMEKVANRHGEHHAELFDLQKDFEELSDELLPHMIKEENILFPYIERLENPKLANIIPPFGTVRNPVRMMMNEHDAAGDLLRRMREITNDYMLPEGACPSYTALFNRLEVFERDLHQHIHLENNLLFPRAVKLEDDYLQN